MYMIGGDDKVRHHLALQRQLIGLSYLHFIHVRIRSMQLAILGTFVPLRKDLLNRGIFVQSLSEILEPHQAQKFLKAV